MPAAERPLREAEFDELFTTSVRAAHRRAPTELRLDLDATEQVAMRTAALVLRETECCSFFTFSLTTTNGQLQLEIAVPETYVEVLDALQTRTEATT